MKFKPNFISTMGPYYITNGDTKQYHAITWYSPVSLNQPGVLGHWIHRSIVHFNFWQLTRLCTALVIVNGPLKKANCRKINNSLNRKKINKLSLIRTPFILLIKTKTCTENMMIAPPFFFSENNYFIVHNNMWYNLVSVSLLCSTDKNAEYTFDRLHLTKKIRYLDKEKRYSNIDFNAWLVGQDF